jgi:hypothetical protein
MADLSRKERSAHRRNELPPRVTRGIIDSVIDERDAELPVRASRHPRENQRERQPEEPEGGRAKPPSCRGDGATPPGQ